MENNYFNAPWRVKIDHEKETVEVVDCNDMPLSDEEEGVRSASLYLISAAPELYAVLSEIMDGESGCDDEWSLQTMTGDMRKLDNMYERIRKILAKAKGENCE